MTILDAAERRFLAQGLEHTTMADIADEAGITRMTLYRYFRDRDPIAFEIAGRMLERAMSVEVPAPSGDATGDAQTLERVRALALAMIRNFERLRAPYRYLGMFDHLYAERYPTEALARWYKQRIEGLRPAGATERVAAEALPRYEHVLMTMNTVMSFLQRLAARGDLMAAEQGLPVNVQLRLFDEMIGAHFDRLVASLPKRRTPKR